MSRFSEYISSVQRFGIRPGLERIEALLERAGNPQTQFPIVLVGGTNGKGSTCEFLAKLLAAQNQRVGLYTSPHLYQWNERIQIRGSGAGGRGSEVFPDAISDDELESLFRDVQSHLEAVAPEHGTPTEFETLTFMGLWHFARKNVDVAVVEVGLGGRWDATNVTNPVVSVVTHVALDHCDRLGSTFEAIACDKIEIARPGCVLVTAETKPAVLEVFREHCDRIGAKLWSFRAPNSGDEMPHEVLSPALETSDFQQLNLKTAQVAYIAFQQATSDDKVQPKVLLPRIEFDLDVPGRAEILRRNPTLMIDGANNPDGAERLAKVLGEAKSAQLNRRLTMVVSFSFDKDYESMLQIWAPLCDRLIATQNTSPRALPLNQLAKSASKYFEAVETAPSVPAAVQLALEQATPNDLICVSGSFFTIAEVPRGV